MQYGQKHCKHLHTTQPGSHYLSPELEESLGQVDATSDSLPISVQAFLLLLPNIPLSANWSFLTLVNFCHLGVGMRPSYKKNHFKIGLHENKHENKWLRSSFWWRKILSLHSKVQLEKAS